MRDISKYEDVSRRTRERHINYKLTYSSVMLGEHWRFYVIPKIEWQEEMMPSEGDILADGNERAKDETTVFLNRVTDANVSEHKDSYEVALRIRRVLKG